MEGMLLPDHLATHITVDSATLSRKRPIEDAHQGDPTRKPRPHRSRLLEVSSGQLTSAAPFLRADSVNSVVDTVARTPSDQHDEQALLTLASIVQNHPLFAPLSTDQKDQVCARARGMHCFEGQVIIRQGTVGDCLYMVASGEYSVSFDDCLLHCTVMPTVYSTGQCFGELALLYNSRRGATVTCTKRGLLFALDQASFRRSFVTSQREARHAFLRSTPLFDKLTPMQVSAISSVMEERVYLDGETIVREGDDADALYVIRSGAAVVVQQRDGQTHELSRMGLGACFGESALTHDARRTATVVAMSATKVLRLGRESFRLMCDTPLPQLLDRNLTRHVLKQMDLFRGMGPTELDNLVSTFEPLEFPPGAKIVTQGEEGETFFVIRSGMVRVTRVQDGEEIVVKDNIGVGEYFGEAALLRQEPRHASVQAVTAVGCLALQRSRFMASLGSRLNVLKRQAAQRTWAAEHIKDRRITLADLRVVEMLGVGTFGRVQLVVHVASNTPFAMKCLSKGQVLEYQQVHHVLNEKLILSLCSHPFLPRLACAFQDDSNLYMLQDLALGGELFSILINSHGGLPFETVVFYAGCITSALRYLHDLQIAHRDLKPENVLVDNDGYLKVVDFGLSKILRHGYARTFCGTNEFLAPEMVLHKPYTCAIDWWALGVLIFEMFTVCLPFGADTPVKLYEKIIAAKIKFPPSVPPAGVDIISKLLTPTPTTRLGAIKEGSRDVIEHHMFASLDFLELERKHLTPPFKPVINAPTDSANFDKDYFDTKPAMAVGHWEECLARRPEARDAFKDF